MSECVLEKTSKVNQKGKGKGNKNKTSNDSTKDANNDTTKKYEGKESSESDYLIGHHHEAPKYLQDNEYILKGYRIGFNSMKSICKSLFMIHNESVNIWTHLLGSLLVLILIIYTATVIKTNQTDIINILDSKWTTINQDFGNFTEPFINKFHSIQNFSLHLPSFTNLTNDLNKKYKESLESLQQFSGSVKNSTFEYMKLIDEKVWSYKEFFSEKINCVDCIKDILEKFGKVKNQIHENYEEFRKAVIEEYMNLYNHTLENTTLAEVLHNVENKLHHLKESVLSHIDSKEMNWIDIYHSQYDDSKSTITRWPLFVMMLGAIVCLSCSTIYHWFFVHSEVWCTKLSTLDFAGISFLIAGSCYPPYYYYFYCSDFLVTTYLTMISVFAIITFIISFKDNFHLPEMRSFRGKLFLGLGLSTTIPVFHMIFFSHTVPGSFEPKIFNWVLGGFFYVSGVGIYLNRIPEKWAKGKFCIVGSSHQIWHLFVIFGILTHYLGSLDMYHDRFNNPVCPVL